MAGRLASPFLAGQIALPCCSWRMPPACPLPQQQSIDASRPVPQLEQVPTPPEARQVLQVSEVPQPQPDGRAPGTSSWRAQRQPRGVRPAAAAKVVITTLA